LGLDTTFKTTNSRKMPGVQFWEDHSGNSDRGGRIFGHQWSIIGLIAHHAERYLFFPVLSQLISGRLNPACHIATPEGAMPNLRIVNLERYPKIPSLIFLQK